ncbi:MAG: hypothetical protein H0T79_21685 [Deltaproteobacteria bacterium]|nr:hypothetical protein [Deltaproteobacteria bacterium]
MLAIALVGTILGGSLAGCAGQPEVDDGAADGGDGKADGSPNVKWSADIDFIVPKPVHEYFEKYQWGDYHIVFHMSRKWYLLGDNGRGWLKRVGEAAADLQEGDPNNGIEFLTMHRAMIEHLTERWGDEAVTNSEDDRTTFGDVLRGWSTDEEMAAHLEKVGGDAAGFHKMLANINDFSKFATEDEFGTFLQTTLRLTGDVDPEDSAIRSYSRDMTAGAGVHNWAHGQFMDDSSLINVGNPQTNLSNQRFWGIHGWIEGKWKQFEAHHVRTAMEMLAYQNSMERFLLHMQLHSDYSTTSHAVNRPSKSLAAQMGPIVFQNGADCANLAVGTQVEGCE